MRLNNLIKIIQVKTKLFSKKNHKVEAADIKRVEKSDEIKG